MDDSVRRQYEAYPYPPRDPADEAKRLVVGSPSHLLEVDHYIFAGRRDFARPFRALIAGGGTGDATIMLAQQLADIRADARIVYLDIAEASLSIARARALARGLTNVEFVHGSIMELPVLGLGRFDYIDSCGVLHHLEDPAAGLAALTEALADDGGMGIMVYAPLGRTGVYHVQAMLRMMAEQAATDVKLDLARRLLASLPATNWLKRNPFVSDHTQLGDAGIHDLLLHSRDRTFSVGDVARLLDEAGLRPVAFIDPLRYEPGVYLKDAQILERVKDLPWIQRAAFAELLCGNMKTHIFYAVKAANRANTVAVPDAPGVVPLLRGLDGPAIARDVGAGGRLTVEMEGLKLNFGLPRLAPSMLALIDGRRTLGEIHRGIAAEADPPPDWPAFLQQFHQLYMTLSGLSRMFLRCPPREATLPNPDTGLPGPV